MLKLDVKPQLGYDSVMILPNHMSKTKSRFANKSLFSPNTYPPQLLNRGGNDMPVVTAPMDSIACEDFIEAVLDQYIDGGPTPMVVFSHRFQSLDKQIEQVQRSAIGLVGGVIGMDSTFEDVAALVSAGARHILLDVANGGNYHVIEKLKQVNAYRETLKVPFFQKINGKAFALWAGNVASVDTYQHIAEYCDYVRVGIGGGAACTTRVNTGIGAGNITAISECREYYERWAYDCDSPLALIVADGGIRNAGDMAKAFAAGAHIVMAGRMFAAVKESAAPPCYDENNNLIGKTYRGMASKAVNIEAGKNMSKASIEGASGVIKITGTVSELLDSINGNLRSTLSYVGVEGIEQLYNKAHLVRVDNSVAAAGKPHMA